MIRLGDMGYTGVGYGLELYGQDSTGTFLLSSSYVASFTAQSGAVTWPVADILHDIFVMQYGSLPISHFYGR